MDLSHYTDGGGSDTTIRLARPINDHAGNLHLLPVGLSACWLCHQPQILSGLLA